MCMYVCMFVWHVCNLTERSEWNGMQRTVLQGMRVCNVL
jgi:hypothetical protein